MLRDVRGFVFWVLGVQLGFTGVELTICWCSVLGRGAVSALRAVEDARSKP